MISKFISFVCISACMISCNQPNNAGVNKISATDSKGSNTINNTKPDSSAGYLLVNGLHMYYEIHGEGNPLVLIHGGGSTLRTSFGQVLPLFAKNRKVIAVELRGHGHTEDVDGPVTFEQDADDVAGLLKQLKIEKADFFGFSNGANTAMQIAIRHPEIVRELIVGSGFYKREGLPPAFWNAMNNGKPEDIPQVYKDAYIKVAPDPKKVLVMSRKDMNRMLTFKDWKDEDIQSIKAPTMILIGDHDVITPEHAVKMYRLLQHGSLTILPGAHGEYMGEVLVAKKGSNLPGATVSIINEFLDNSLAQSAH